MSAIRRAAVAVLVLTSAGLSTLASAPPVAGASCATNPFTGALSSELSATWPAQRFTAAVYDVRTGCEYHLQPGVQLTTASVVKIEVMAGVLLRAQSEGRDLTQWERDRIWPMITESADGPTNELWSSLGGAPAMDQLDAAFGLAETVPASPKWGETVTTARDQVHLLRQVLLGQFGPLHQPYIAEAWTPMSNVVPSQRWGITAGVPEGWTVAQKNGFANSGCCQFRVNSSGVVVAPGGQPAYAVTILSDRWPSIPDGIPGVERISRAIAAALARPLPTGSGAVYDRDGDGRADPVVIGNGTCPSQQRWYWALSAAGYGEELWGGRNGGCDVLMSADVDGDAVADPTAVRPNGDGNLEWWSRRSHGGGASVALWGRFDDVPLIGDYDGDGRTDVAVMRPAAGNGDNTWYVQLSGGGTIVKKWGNAAFVDTPITGDYDGDGRTDIALVRRAGNYDLEWWVAPSSGDTRRLPFAMGAHFGRRGDTVVPGEWLADGRTDLAVVRAEPSGNDRWYFFGVGQYAIVDWGRAATDALVPADYDGDGRTDVAVWRGPPGETGSFWIRRSHDNSLSTFVWGKGGRDITPFAGSVFPTPN